MAHSRPRPDGRAARVPLHDGTAVVTLIGPFWGQTTLASVELTHVGRAARTEVIEWREPALRAASPEIQEATTAALASGLRRPVRR